MNWKDYKLWCKEVKKYLRTPRYLLSKDNVVDMDKSTVKDSYGNVYQAKANFKGVYCGLVKIKEK